MHSINMPEVEFSVEVSQSQIEKNASTIIVNRPQSPRQFFEKLYGHLENTSTNNNNSNNQSGHDVIPLPIASPMESEISSSSPEITDNR